MLIASLVLSAVLLVALNVTAFKSGSILSALPWCSLGLLGYGFCMVFLPAFLLHTALTLGAGLICAWIAPRPRVFLPVTAIAFLVAYGVVGAREWIEFAEMTRENAPVSVSQRLAYENRPLQLPDSPQGDAGINLIATRIDSSSTMEETRENSSRYLSRVIALQLLHNQQVASFVNSPGFGFSRGPRGLKQQIDLPEESPVPIDESESSIPLESAASLLVGGHLSLQDSTRGKIESLHRASVNEFVFPQGFGYMKSRGQVIGFRPHHFSQKPTYDMSAWRFHKVELVSLLKHDKPAVYLSDNLPRMSELRNARTRPLDLFEAAALPRLAIDDLLIHSTDDRLRVLGSIRAAEVCLSCHAGKKGDLLGAFSYYLDRQPRK